MTACSPDFAAWLKGIAAENGMTAIECCRLWREYAKACRFADQSPVTSEFLKWNNLKGEPKR